jgi:hypothetical protein
VSLLRIFDFIIALQVSKIVIIVLLDKCFSETRSDRENSHTFVGRMDIRDTESVRNLKIPLKPKHFSPPLAAQENFYKLHFSLSNCTDDVFLKGVFRFSQEFPHFKKFTEFSISAAHVH